MKGRLVLLCAAVSALLVLAEAPAGLAQASAPPSPAARFSDCPDVCPVMVRVPGGSFQMGDASGLAQSDEGPVHAVTVPAFAAGAYEVTQAEFAAFVAATGFTAPAGCQTDSVQSGRWRFYPDANWRNPGFPTGDRLPVVCVSWADANAYTAWLSQKTGKRYRLLSEAEWEYAARAGTSTQYWWGDSPDALCAYANGPDASAKTKFPQWPAAACDDGQALAAPVGSFKPNAFGLYDMAGNAWEWTADCYEADYDVQPRNGTAYTGGGCFRRVLRGGSWVYGLGDLRSTRRNHLPPPQIHGGDIGFRVARDL
ncbi:MAG: formylglycine-generating enzyme family protein [Caulobacteraceae bacterium]